MAHHLPGGSVTQMVNPDGIAPFGGDAFKAKLASVPKYNVAVRTDEVFRQLDVLSRSFGATGSLGHHGGRCGSRRKSWPLSASRAAPIGKPLSRQLGPRRPTRGTPSGMNQSRRFTRVPSNLGVYLSTRKPRHSWGWAGRLHRVDLQRAGARTRLPVTNGRQPRRSPPSEPIFEQSKGASAELNRRIPRCPCERKNMILRGFR
jgi:hypothetical protein